MSFEGEWQVKKNTSTIIIIGVFLLIQPISAQTWEAAKGLTWNSGPSYVPEIAEDSSNNIHIVWEDDINWSSGKYDIFYKKSTDGGVSWLASKRLIWTSGYSKYPAITTDLMDSIYVVWEDDTPGNKEIYYKKGIQ